MTNYPPNAGGRFLLVLRSWEERLVDLCLILLTTLHLLAVNIAAAGPLVCLMLEWRGRRRGEPATDRLAQWLGRLSVGSLLLGGLLGAAGVWLLSLGGNEWFFESLHRFPRIKFWYTGAELVFYLACMWGYLAWWKRSPRERLWQRIGHRLLAVLASTNLLYHFPPLFVAFTALATAPAGTWAEAIDPAVYRRLMIDSEVASRSLHHVLASLAIVGVVVMGQALRQRRSGSDSQTASRLIVWGARLALLPTLLQLPVGVWVLVEYPQRELLLGDNRLSTGLLVGSIAMALMLMHHLSAVALGDVDRKSVIRSMALMAAVVLLMTGTLHHSRGVMLNRHAGPTRWQPELLE